jgi:hypothetical protein
MNADPTPIAADGYRIDVLMSLSAAIGGHLSAFIGAFKAVVL